MVGQGIQVELVDTRAERKDHLQIAEAFQFLDGGPGTQIANIKGISIVWPVVKRHVRRVQSEQALPLLTPFGVRVINETHAGSPIIPRLGWPGHNVW